MDAHKGAHGAGGHVLQELLPVEMRPTRTRPIRLKPIGLGPTRPSRPRPIGIGPTGPRPSQLKPIGIRPRPSPGRSEERRVGKEDRTRGVPPRSQTQYLLVTYTQTTPRIISISDYI